MSNALMRIRFTAQQMELMIGILQGHIDSVLPNNPKLFGLMSEGPIDQLEEMRKEIIELVDSLAASHESDALKRIRTTAEAMEKMLLALEDLKNNVLPDDAKMVATMSEAPIDDLEKMRKEIIELADQIQTEEDKSTPPQSQAPIDAPAPQPGHPSSV